MPITASFRQHLISTLLALGLCQVLPAQAGLITIEGQGSGSFDVPNTLEFTAVVEDSVSDTDFDSNLGFYAGALTEFDFVLLRDGGFPINATGLTGDVTVTRNEFGFDLLQLFFRIGEVTFYAPTGIFSSDSLVGALDAGIAGEFSEFEYASYSSPRYRGAGASDDFSFAAQGVPLPATGSMLTLGLLLMFCRWRLGRTFVIRAMQNVDFSSSTIAISPTGRPL